MLRRSASEHLLAQGLGVDQVAVVGQGDAERRIDVERLRLVHAFGASSGITAMGDADAAFEHRHLGSSKTSRTRPLAFCTRRRVPSAVARPAASWPRRAAGRSGRHRAARRRSGCRQYRRCRTWCAFSGLGLRPNVKVAVPGLGGRPAEAAFAVARRRQLDIAGAPRLIPPWPSRRLALRGLPPRALRQAVPSRREEHYRPAGPTCPNPPPEQTSPAAARASTAHPAPAPAPAATAARPLPAATSCSP